ncbi:hypothetical protein [Amycolatopsis sp.]|uniref:hypothetical protein n=1 Tax=Amycolatopsis sp. TaxID=37632 RepID=UPI002BF00F25|nr:hypothetical protein [Amycolatopsis sp.]HVV12214.1 hypothetical protein [Amycolatopsis sp.]
MDTPTGRRIEEISAALADPETWLEEIRLERTRAEAKATNLVREHRVRNKNDAHAGSAG